MIENNTQVLGQSTQVIETNKVLRNTYALLSMTLLFSAFTSFLAISMNVPYLGPWITLGGYMGLLFLTTKLRNSAWGLLSVFALTGFMGFTVGPIINHYLSSANGGQLVTNALGGTAIIFLGLSGYALTTRKDFSFMRGFLFIGFLVAFLAAIGNIFLQMPALSLTLSVVFILLSSALILYQTSDIIHGGETNYIMATVSLYISIYNIFLSLLQLMGVMSSDD